MFNRAVSMNGVDMSLAVAALCAFTLSSAEQLSVSSSANAQIDSFFVQYINPDNSIDFKITKVTPDPDTEYFVGGSR